MTRLCPDAKGSYHSTACAPMARGPKGAELLSTNTHGDTPHFLLNGTEQTRIATWNVLTLGQVGKAELLIKELERYKVEMAAITEIRWRAEGADSLAGGRWKFLHSAADDKGVGGVGIIMTGRAKAAWEAAGGTWTAHGRRIVEARLQNRTGFTTMVAVYAPTEEHPEATDEFYDQLQKVVEKIPKRDVLLLLGDFNARLGKKNTTYERVMGTCALDEEQNTNGERLVQFCQVNRLFIQGTRFPHRDIHKATWIHPATKKGHQIDHIITNARWFSCVEDVKVIRGAMIDSDHHLVVADIKLHWSKAPKKEKANPWKFRMMTEMQKKDYQAAVEKGLREKAAGGSVEEKWTRIRDVVKEEMKEAAKKVEKTPRKEWLSTTTLDLVEEKRRAFMDWQQTFGLGDTTEEEKRKKVYQEKSKEVKKAVRGDKKKWFEETAERMEKAAKVGNSRSLFEEVKKLTGKKKEEITRIQDKDKVTHTKQKEIADVFSEYFNKLLNVKNTVRQDLVKKIKEERHEDPLFTELARTPTTDEVATAIRKLKPRKAAGEDGIIGEALAWGGPPLWEEVAKLIHEIWEKEEVPEEWGGGLLVPIFKAGNKADADNYRGIALLNITGKVFTRILNERLMTVAEMILLEQQSGFRKGRGTTDQIFCVRQMIEKHIEHHDPLYMAFIDLKKAYDSVSRSLLFDILRAEGLPEKLVVLIEKLYAKTSLKVRIKQEIGKGVDISTGVRQGCVISPVLFNLFLNYILKQIKPQLEERGVKLCYRIGDSLFKLDKEGMLEMNEWAFAYADDLVLMSDEKEKLHESLKIFDEAVADAGMEMSVAKTKVMQTGEGAEDISIDFGARGTVKEVKEFKYLGSLITNDGSMTREISERIGKAGGVFAAMRRNVFAVKAMSKEVKLRVYSASVLSVLLYGSETWNCTAAEIRRLESFHNRCLRCMFGISKLTHFTNFALRKLTGQQTIQSMIMNNRLRWLGHVMRMSDERMPKRMMFGKLQTARPAGGTKQRWKDCVQQDLKCMEMEDGWTDLAQQRDKWHAATRKAVASWERGKNAKEQADYEQRKAGIGVKCPQCDFVAKNEKGLKSHVGQKHPKWEYYPEDASSEESDEDEPFGKKRTTTTRKSRSSTSAPSSSSSSSRNSKYLCPQCGKDCSSGSGLSSHLRHSGHSKEAGNHSKKER